MAQTREEKNAAVKRWRANNREHLTAYYKQYNENKKNGVKRKKKDWSNNPLWCAMNEYDGMIGREF